MRISLSERAAELATLRVLGFSDGQVFWVLAGELALLLVVSLPLGWAAGYVNAAIMGNAMDADLMRMPLVIDRGTYVLASVAVVVAAVLSAMFAWRRIKDFDLVAVLKTRD